MRVAAYQAPLLEPQWPGAIDRLRAQVERCEAEDVSILCCPEALFGGLADDVADPDAVAIDTSRIGEVLAPLSSNRVATIVGFTERGSDRRLYNSAAVVRRGDIAGVYRKHHPAIRRSIYAPGHDTPVFGVAGLTFGVLICYDTAFAEPAAALVRRGATVLFVPSNTALPPARTGPWIVTESRDADRRLALEHGVWVIRADVAGTTASRVAYGASGVVDPRGAVRHLAESFAETLVVADLAP